MRLLLDTHALVWTMAMADRLPDKVAAEIRNMDNDLWLSAASVYEIEYKRDRHDFLKRLPTNIIGAADVLPARWLSISPGHAATAARLDAAHRDPWDRLIVGQAIVEDLVLVSADRALDVFGMRRFW